MLNMPSSAHNSRFNVPTRRYDLTTGKQIPKPDKTAEAIELLSAMRKAVLSKETIGFASEEAANTFVNLCSNTLDGIEKAGDNSTDPIHIYAPCGYVTFNGINGGIAISIGQEDFFIPHFSFATLHQTLTTLVVNNHDAFPPEVYSKAAEYNVTRQKRENQYSPPVLIFPSMITFASGNIF